jgi:hypothetical protein
MTGLVHVMVKFTPCELKVLLSFPSAPTLLSVRVQVALYDVLPAVMVRVCAVTIVIGVDVAAFFKPSYGEKTDPGHCPEQQLIAQRPSMINQAQDVFSQGSFRASLIYVLIVSPSPAVPSTSMPPPSRNTSAGRLVVPGTALLPLSFLPSSEKETICDFPCPDGSALHGNAANTAARLAAAMTLQIDELCQAFLFD